MKYLHNTNYHPSLFINVRSKTLKFRKRNDIANLKIQLFQNLIEYRYIMEEYSREPCPWRIIDDCGGAFTMGLIGGSLFNGIQGFRHAPSGLNRRTMGGLVRLKERAPVLGGQFAAWGLCFATFDCSIAYMRQVTLFLSVLFGANAV